MNFERRAISSNESGFLREALGESVVFVGVCAVADMALAEGLRIDGRRLIDARPLRLSLTGNGSCEAQLGTTRLVLASLFAV